MLPQVVKFVSMYNTLMHVIYLINVYDATVGASTASTSTYNQQMSKLSGRVRKIVKTSQNLATQLFTFDPPSHCREYKAVDENSAF